MPARFRPVRSQPNTRNVRATPRLALMWVLAFMIAILSSLVYADYRVRPMVGASAMAVAKRAATAALNDAVTAEIADDVDFDKIVHLDKAKDGKMEAAHIDFSAVTELQSAATDRADSALHALSVTTLRLPWTQVVGGTLFTTFTPNLRVRMTLIGDAHSSIEMETRTEGVNQSVHIVYLDLTADVNVVSPFVTWPISIQSRIPIAYLVLAGEVPKTFVAGGVTGSPYIPPTVLPPRP